MGADHRQAGTQSAQRGSIPSIAKKHDPSAEDLVRGLRELAALLA